MYDVKLIVKDDYSEDKFSDIIILDVFVTFYENDFVCFGTINGDVIKYLKYKV